MTPAMSAVVALIPIVVPIILSLLRTAIPSIPKGWVPIIAPILGALADVMLYFAGGPNIGAQWGALLGSAGVGLREIVDQFRKGNMNPSTAEAAGPGGILPKPPQ